MDAISLELTTPHAAADESEREVPRAATLGLRPALFARYADLERLRYDYPLVLVEGAPADEIVRSLSAIVDGLLRALAPPGPGGERLRRHLLRLESAIRIMVARGARDRLSRLWLRAEAELLAQAEPAARATLGANLDLARDALDVDGMVIGCDEATPADVVVHAWTTVHTAKAKAFRRKVEGLILRLSDILKTDFMKSERSRRPDQLRASVGGTFETDFDFQAMSRILLKGSGENRLPVQRRRRIHEVISALKTQRFYAPGRASDRRLDRPEPFGFVFDNCAAALDAFRARLPDMVEIVKAISIAELEIENRYSPSTHDPFFARFDETAFSHDDFALFPSYLVCLRDRRCEAAEAARVFEILASDLPAKVLFQTDDILGDPSRAPDPASFGGGSARLAAMALGAASAYVFQAPSSGLYRARARLVKGMAYDGPALFSVYSGCTKSVSGVPPYLLAAAAMESRAFPTFTYDPAAGPDWASRFDVGDNPQAEGAWPVHDFAYEDADLQRAAQRMAFTPVDFAACDARFARHRMPLAREDWDEAMIPAGERLTRGTGADPAKVAYVWMIDEGDVLRRAVVDDTLMRVGDRVGETWRSLQELAGIDNSHARRALERERAAWEAEKERELADLRQRPAAEPAAPPAPEPDAAAAATEAAPDDDAAGASDAASGDPYIETARCTTCHECIQINGKMFAYDDNMQAFIADAGAGTYRQMVEAAESCQVSIIHPGKPRDPGEPNLDELIRRAEPFN